MRTSAAVLAAAVALGAGAPVATAAPTDHARPGHVKVAKGDRDTLGKKGEQALRQLLRDIARTDARLGKVTREKRLARIGEHAAGVVANVSADRSDLADLAAAVQAADSTHDLRQTRKALKELRVQNYERVVNDLRHAVKLAAEIAEARTASEGDPAAPTAELDAAQAALDAAVAKALLVTASSDRSELRAVKRDLQAAHVALGAVLGDSDDSVEDEVEDEDEVEEDETLEDGVDDVVVEEPVAP